MKKRIKVIIFRSNRSIEAQAIFEDKVKFGRKYVIKKVEESPVLQCKSFGENFGAELIKNNIKNIRFDRNDFKYHGRVKAFAKGMRRAKVVF